jgi:hypothetical protein
MLLFLQVKANNKTPKALNKPLLRGGETGAFHNAFL